MRQIRFFIVLFCLAMVFSLLACSSGSISDASANLTKDSINTSLSKEIDALKVENDDLKSELTTLKAKTASLESTIEQSNLSGIDSAVCYDLEAIIGMMNASGSKTELFTAEIDSVSLETMNGIRHFVFNINRHSPDWGWESASGDETAGYPIKSEVQGSVRVIYKYKSYMGQPEDLVNELNGSHETLKFLMIDNNVLFIAAQTGP